MHTLHTHSDSSNMVANANKLNNFTRGLSSHLNTRVAPSMIGAIARRCLYRERLIKSEEASALSLAHASTKKA